MKLPRDISGKELAKRLEKYGYRITRQTGSHLRLTQSSPKMHHITIPNHPSLKIGTLNAVLNSVADHLKIDKRALTEDLFG
ncbi:MAG: type II toxin-antitoxin system HicA family toxin [Calditrichia bacterium]